MTKTLTGYDVLLCQGVITKTSQTMSHKRMTLNDSCHKHA